MTKPLLTETQADKLAGLLEIHVESLALAPAVDANSKEARAIAKRGLALADSLRRAFGAI